MLNNINFVRVTVYSLAIVIVIAITYLNIVHTEEVRTSKKINACDTYNIKQCPDECVICPPCPECSSISCQTQEFCLKMGIDKNWYESVKTE